ncbi:MAG: hypothetical protein AAFR93_07635 [Pseudomonadota bacterium]
MADWISNATLSVDEWISGLKIWEPGRTEGLIADLEGLHAEMVAITASQIDKKTVLEGLDTQLKGIQAKATYLEGLITQTLENFPPPDPSGEHAGYLDMKDRVYDPLNLIGQVAGGVAIASLAGIGLQWLGGHAIGYLFKSTGARALAASATTGRWATLGKAGLAAAFAAIVISTVIKMFKASEINDELRSKIVEMEEQVAEARNVEAQLDVAISQAETQLDEILASAGAADLQVYMDQITAALDQVGRERVHVGSGRRMLRMGISKDDILSIIQGLEPATLNQIEARLNAEIQLIQGNAPADVARSLQLSEFQITVFQRILAARADAVMGVAAEVLAQRHALSLLVAEMQVERANNALVDHWDKIEGEGDLGVIARDTLISATAYAGLRNALAAKTALAQGRTVEEVGEIYPDLAPEDLTLWAERLPTRLAEASKLAGGSLDRGAIAAHLRLPTDLVPEAPQIAA